MNRRRVLLGLAALAFFACAWNEAAVEPVWGKQTCAHCSMILSERRFGAELVTRDGDRLFFDDVGCMVLAMEARAAGSVRVWVHEAESGRWLDARSARYVGGVSSPMDYGFEARAEGPVGWDDVRARVLAKSRGAR